MSEHLLDDVYFPVCSPRLGGGRLPTRPAEISRYLLLRSEDEYWQPWFRAAGLDWPEPTRGPIFNDASHLMQAAVDGQGIALARSSLIGNDIANGVLVRLFDVEVPSPFRYYLVYPTRLAAFAEAPALSRVAPGGDRARRRDAERVSAAARHFREDGAAEAHRGAPSMSANICSDARRLRFGDSNLPVGSSARCREPGGERHRVTRRVLLRRVVEIAEDVALRAPRRSSGAIRRGDGASRPRRQQSMRAAQRARSRVE